MSLPSRTYRRPDAFMTGAVWWDARRGVVAAGVVAAIVMLIGFYAVVENAMERKSVRDLAARSGTTIVTATAATTAD